MSGSEYRKLRNGVIIAFIPIFAAVAYGAAGMHFGMKTKVDRIEVQQSLYEQQVLLTDIIERKTSALEKMVLEDTDYEQFLEIKTEVRNLQHRIDRHFEEHTRMRGVSDAVH